MSFIDFYLKISNLIAQKSFKQAIVELESLPFDQIRHNPSLLNAFGVALRASGQPMRAINMYTLSLNEDPENSGTWSNLGNAFKDANLLTASITAHQRALNLSNTSSAQLWHNHGIAMSIAGQHDQAIDSIQKAIELSPEKKSLRWDLARSQLAIQNYSDGFFNYQFRWDMEDAPERRVFGNEWQGEDLGKESLFVYVEQGFGDYIQCSRFLPLLNNKATTIEIEVKPELIDLMKNSFPNLQFTPYKADRIDRPKGKIVSILDLPRFFLSEQTLSGTPYLRAKPLTNILKEHILKKLQPPNELHIGVIWSGSTTFKRNQYRSAPVEWFHHCLKVPKCNLHSLQLGPRSNDLAKIGFSNISNSLSNEIKSFNDTANIIRELDLVITTCTSTVHLCGSLGVTCWTLLDYSPHWLWGPTGELTPWYSSVKLFRQTTPGDWRSVFDKVSADLIQLKR